MKNKNHTIENGTQNYPRFISNQPSGIDKTKGYSQKRLANAIVDHITSTDKNSANKIPRIIGLKGEWGIGKSNVVRQLQENLKSMENYKYYIFEYDAWGHQENLQRRSFLETLTSTLIKKEILIGNTKIRKKNGQEELITWDEKLGYLLSRKRQIETEKRPKLNDSFVYVVAATIFTPILAIIANNNSISKIWWLSVLITILPLLFLFFLLIKKKYKYKKKFSKKITWKEIFNEIISIYSGKIENDISYETICEDEPSVADFKKWMQDISDHIGNFKQKLIVVYDNMDRLPADKVKELWSSIHTFFADTGFANVWVIIPFDEKHLSCAFGENKDKEQLTKHFISKTFPIVYRVTPPVITDYKDVFYELFEEAFGDTIDEEIKSKIFRIFKLEKPEATYREMIEFINSLVALKQIWKEEIDLLYCAVFKIKEKEIIENPINELKDKQQETKNVSKKNNTIEEKILSGKYLSNYMKNIVPNDEILQTNIAALVYGISKELAEQIPMKKYIESCFNNNENDINKYSKSSIFIPILQETIQDADIIKTNEIIKSLSMLNIDSFDEDKKVIITTLWDELAKRKENQELLKQEFDDTYKVLLSNVTDKTGLVRRICMRIQRFGDEEPTLIFTGTEYYIALKNIQEFISENNMNIDITQYLNDIEKDPKIFIEYVQIAKDNYKTFKLSTDNNNLNNHFFNGEDNKIKDLSILKHINGDPHYRFDTLKQKIENFISTTELSVDNFKQVFDAYKLISDKKPLAKQLTLNQRTQIWDNLSTKTNTDDYLEIVAILLANNMNINQNLSEQQQIEYIAKQMDYYGNYGDLLISSNNQTLNNVLKYMTENKLGEVLSLENVLPNFFEIKEKIDVTESKLLEQLNRWHEDKNKITTENISSIVPADLFLYSKETINELTTHINKTAMKALTSIDEETLHGQLNDPNQHSYKVADNLINTGFCPKLPNKLTELGKRYLDDIAAGSLAIPNEKHIVQKIINKLDSQSTSALIKDIRDKYCNSVYNINPQLFLYFENWFENQGNLKQVADRATHKIIEPVINDNDCLNLIISKSDYYADIINAAGDDATTLKDNVRNMLLDTSDENLILFAKKIGIEKKENE